MLESKFKIALLLVVLAAASLPVMGIIRGTILPPFEQDTAHQGAGSAEQSSQFASDEAPVGEEMVLVPAGTFIRGTDQGGFDEQPKREIFLDSFMIDRNEVTNAQYAAFVAATGHRKSGPRHAMRKIWAKCEG
ncbi:MAG: SUMF1/EgtB/PvdO family nonheme iron enzyme [Nitrospiraceae bacterium]